ncbi:hypothetical protein [Streptomyces sp. ISL-86]|uniref:hypothetical protein n=1 Tax=Streptomyces sp. ISL-86 TaxID=2819187 RepID=UPI0035A85794
MAAFTGTALLGLLVLPQASADFWARHLPASGRALLLDWPHLWVWCVPLLTLLTRAARRRPGKAAPCLIPVPRSPLGQEDVRVVEDAQHHEQQSTARHHVLGHDL